MRAAPGHPPGHAQLEPAAEAALRPAGSGGAFPATPLRCQASDRLVALTTTAVGGEEKPVQAAARHSGRKQLPRVAACHWS